MQGRNLARSRHGGVLACNMEEGVGAPWPWPPPPPCLSAESVTAGMSPAVAVALSPRAGIGDHQWQFPFAQRESESMFACGHYGGFGRQHELDAGEHNATREVDAGEHNATREVDAGEHNATREVDGAGEDNQEVEPTIKVYRPEPGIFALYRLGWKYRPMMSLPSSWCMRQIAAGVMETEVEREIGEVRHGTPGQLELNLSYNITHDIHYMYCTQIVGYHPHQKPNPSCGVNAAGSRACIQLQGTFTFKGQRRLTVDEAATFNEEATFTRRKLNGTHSTSGLHGRLAWGQRSP